eukprot:GILJ01001566.1.p1 GENE.GILJ01001566.1~~GILJ01001566.1.p1  ORF type:complete len:255 (+),score=28.32 GILJ01001566.1:89-766(+)
MSSAVLGKRTAEDSYHQSIKRLRCSSVPRLVNQPVESPEDALENLRQLFPAVEPRLLEAALQQCQFNLEATIQQLQQQQQQQQQQQTDLDQSSWQEELCSPSLTGHLSPALAIVVAAVYCACTTCISGSWNSALALSRSNLSGGSWIEPRCPAPASIRLCAEGVDTFRSAAEELSDHIKHLALPSSYDSRTAYIQESIVQLRQEQDRLREFIVNAYGSNQFLPTD